MADEQVTATVNKPLLSKAPSKEAGAPQSKYSGRHHVPNPSNGELHSQYHGYYVKLNASKHRPEDRQEDEGSSHSSSALVHKPSPNKWSAPKSGTKPVAKESKAEPKAKKSELATPKNPASHDPCPSLEKEANSVSWATWVFSSFPPLVLWGAAWVGGWHLGGTRPAHRAVRAGLSTFIDRKELCVVTQPATHLPQTTRNGAKYGPAGYSVTS